MSYRVSESELIKLPGPGITAATLHLFCGRFDIPEESEWDHTYYDPATGDFVIVTKD